MSKFISPNDIIKSDLCIGCGICSILDVNTHIQIKFDKYGQYKPGGDTKWLNTSSELFDHICPFSPTANNEDDLSKELFPNLPNNTEIGRYLKNYVGYSTNENLRLNSSSGALTTWVAMELINKGIVDGIAHVIPSKKDSGKYFKYSISRNVDEIMQGAKSRYYPVELSEVLKTIKEVPGRYAVIAIPCIIKGVHLLKRQDKVFRERILFTLGLFCGHMKSSHFAESFAWQMNIALNEISSVEYRYKQPNRPANWYTAQFKLKNDTTIQKDWWHLVDGDWGAGFFMNSTCNFCDDVVAETADISFGDAWLDPYSSDGRGTNVIVVRSAIINNLLLEGIHDGRLMLKEVSPELVEQTQAAAFRQRREGLAYRLGWIKKRVQLKKRIRPDSYILTGSRKSIYRLRYYISKWSHRLFFVARKLHMPFIYLLWARITAAIYYGIAYKKGSIRMIIKRYFELGS